MIHNNEAFLNAIQGLQSFVLDTNADIDMAYDWVADQSGISSFVHENQAWDMFYDTWENANV
jgi:hypothetical protein